MAVIDGGMLRTVRDHRRISQQQLADRSKIGIATIKRIEAASSPSSVRIHTAECLADALGLKVGDLARNNYRRVIDIGEDVELVLDRTVDIDLLREKSEELLSLLEIRNRILGVDR